MHARFSPRPHRFVYRLFLFAIDLDELDALHRGLALFSVDRPNLFSFRDQDYLPTGEPLHNAGTGDRPARDGPGSLPPPARPASLKQRVRAFMAARGVDLADGRVMLVTLPRVAGYGFNPVSFYFCYDRSGAPLAALAEVKNTFKEMKPYWLGPETAPPGPKFVAPGPTREPLSPAAFRLRTPKHFYVSPFSDVDVAFDFTLHPPAERLAVQIDDFVGSDRTLTTTLTGARRELTGAHLGWFAIKYPFITVRIIALIHWHALRLWIKRVPWFAKAARAGDQRGLYRPHDSLLQPSDLA